MNNLQYTAEEIKLKVARLLQKADMLQRQLEAKEDECEWLRETVEEQKNAINRLQEQNKIIKLAESLHSSTGDKQEIKRLLTVYIREIDECIRLLSER